MNQFCFLSGSHLSFSHVVLSIDILDDSSSLLVYIWVPASFSYMAIDGVFCTNC